MKLNNGLFIGKIGNIFTLHNSKKLIELKSKNLQGAIKEAEKYKVK